MRTILSLLLSLTVLSSVYGAPSSAPPGSGAPLGGYFTTYFQNLQSINPCPTGMGVVGFSSTIVPQCGYLFWEPDPSDPSGTIMVNKKVNINGDTAINGNLTANNLNLANGNISGINYINGSSIGNYVNLGYLSSITPGRIPKAIGANSIGDSHIYDDGAGYIGIGTTAPSRTLDVNGDIIADNLILRSNSNITGVGMINNQAIGNFITQSYLGPLTNNYIPKANPFFPNTLLNSSIQDNGWQVSIGDISNPTKNLTVHGTTVTNNLRVNDGNEGPGKVLMSDTIGNASWQAPAAGGGNMYIGTTPDVYCAGGWCNTNTLFQIASPGTMCISSVRKLYQNYRYGGISCDYDQSSGRMNQKSWDGVWGGCNYICSGTNNGGYPYAVTLPPPPPVYGCTNVFASNYNPSATQDDGTCIMPSTPPGTGFEGA